MKSISVQSGDDLEADSRSRRMRRRSGAPWASTSGRRAPKECSSPRTAASWRPRRARTTSSVRTRAGSRWTPACGGTTSPASPVNRSRSAEATTSRPAWASAAWGRVLLADEDDAPARPAILYGVDTRSGDQIERMTHELGIEAITRVGGSTLTSQAGGPCKILWVAEEEPGAYARARRLLMPASWLVRRLTGAYVLDHQSASQTSPLHDIDAEAWHIRMVERYAGASRHPRCAGPARSRVKCPPRHPPSPASPPGPRHHRDHRCVDGGRQRRRPRGR